MKQKFQHFMTGRYGVDQLSRILMFFSLGFLLVSMFTRWNLLYIGAIAILGYTYFRMFSKNVSKRYEENQKFLNWKYHLVVKKNNLKKHREDCKVYRFYQCPNCSQKIRVPKGKGKISISCPKCSAEFIKKS